MSRDPQVIRKEIEATKAELEQNLYVLKERCRAGLEDAKQAVGDKVDEAKAVVHKLNPAYQAEEHPLVMFGAAVVVGALAGGLVSRPARDTRRNAERIVEPKEEWTGEPSLFTRELGILKSVALRSAARFVGRKARERFPAYSEDIEELVDGVVQGVQGVRYA